MSESDKAKNFLALDTRVDDIMAIINALRILIDIKSFRSWLAANRRSSKVEKYLDGYKLTFRALLERLIEEIERDVALGLSSNSVFDRFSFTGRVPISKLPNSCDKVVLIKNVRKAAKPMLKATDWKQLEIASLIFLRDILPPLIQLKSITDVNSAYNISSLDEAIKYVTMFELYIFLNDTRSGVPHGYPDIILENKEGRLYQKKNGRFLSTSFNGYKYSVQFMWSKLLGASFSNSPLAYIHRAKGWTSLDEYFESIRTKVIHPIELEIGTLLGLAALMTIREGAKAILHPLLSKLPPEPTLSEREQLEQLFLWYEIELIDASQNTLFNGIPAFISALLGSIEIKRKADNPDKTQIIRLMHPKELHGYANFYSYAVLMEVGGLFSDSSGWLLFFKCCYDTGSGRRGLEYIEQFITEYFNKGLIAVKEVQVPAQKLLSLLDNYLISATKLEMQDIHETKASLREIKDRFDTSRGLLLEFIACYLHSYLLNKDNTRVEWNYTHHNQQIDLIVRQKDSILFFECTNCADTLVDDLKRIKEKAELMWHDNVFRKEWDVDDNSVKECVIFSWDRPSKHIMKQIRSQGSNFLCLSDLFDVHPKLVHKSRDKLSHVFGKKQDVSKKSLRKKWHFSI